MDKLSKLSETLIGSEIVRLGNEISARIRQGEHIYNFTIGDFDPKIFPIPIELENLIIKAYQDKYTNYPSGEGILPLREAIAHLIEKNLGISYAPTEIQVASGGRPLIYSIYRAIVDVGDKVIYPTPSWNNNHYTHFNQGQHIALETLPGDKFMPTPDQLAEHIQGASLISLCSPLNPTGTTFSKETLEAICDMVIEENERRGADEKKLYVLYDQIYWMLTHGDTKHYNPVSLRPAMQQYTIFVDGISKSFAATGVRVGWSLGPEKVIAKVKAILSHIGAWAPMAEQVACAQYLKMDHEIEVYLTSFKKSINDRLLAYHNGFQALKGDGLQVDSITPEAAMYLTVKIDMIGKTKPDGTKIETNMDVWNYILNQAKVALVPFTSFGASKESPWYRLSVGTCKLEEVATVMGKIKEALSLLS
jgi:aspartate aminotransferase